MSFVANIPRFYVAGLYRMILLNNDIAVSSNFRGQTGLEDIPPKELAHHFTRILFNQIVKEATESVINLVRKPHWEFFYDPFDFMANLVYAREIRRCLSRFL